MSNTLALLKERRQEIIDIAAKHGMYNVRGFGSVVRNEDRPDSDIDLLVSRGEKVQLVSCGVDPGARERIGPQCRRGDG